MNNKYKLIAYINSGTLIKTMIVNTAIMEREMEGGWWLPWRVLSTIGLETYK